MDDLKNYRVPLLHYIKFVHYLKPLGEFKLELLSGNAQDRRFFVPCDLEIWHMTLKNNRATLLCCFKLCTSFHSPRWIQTKVTVQKHSIWVKISDLSRVTLKFDGWPWKTKEHLFYATSSFMHHFIAIDEFKLELQSGNSQFGLKSTIFCALRPWNLKDDLEKQQGTSPKQHQALYFIPPSYVNLNWSYNPEMPNLGQIWQFLELCDLEIWWMTFKNNRAPFLCYFKLSAAFRSHWWIQTGATVWKRPIWVKFDKFYRHMTLKFDGWPWKKIGPLFYATSSSVHHWVAIV